MNHAFAIAILAAAAYWILDYAIGTDANRDLMAAAAIFYSLLNVGRYAPPAWRAFRRGGLQDNWQLLMGNVLFWAGFGMRETWLWSVRSEGRPDWMVGHPINGFFTFWILGAGILCFYAAERAPGPIPRHRLAYYVLVGIIAASIAWVVRGWV